MGITFKENDFKKSLTMVTLTTWNSQTQLYHDQTIDFIGQGYGLDILSPTYIIQFDPNGLYNGSISWDSNPAWSWASGCGFNSWIRSC